MAKPAVARRQTSPRRGIEEMRKLHPNSGKASELWQQLLADQAISSGCRYFSFIYFHNIPKAIMEIV
jgi:hypothetical protein